MYTNHNLHFDNNLLAKKIQNAEIELLIKLLINNLYKSTVKYTYQTNAYNKFYTNTYNKF
jgi:hypothetical protein